MFSSLITKSFSEGNRGVNYTDMKSTLTIDFLIQALAFVKKTNVKNRNDIIKKILDELDIQFNSALLNIKSILKELNPEITNYDFESNKDNFLKNLNDILNKEMVQSAGKRRNTTRKRRRRVTRRKGPIIPKKKKKKRHTRKGKR